jgi:hypothetical protein
MGTLSSRRTPGRSRVCIACPSPGDSEGLGVMRPASVGVLKGDCGTRVRESSPIAKRQRARGPG